ncbi:conserved hypothetical protein [Streptomyces sp. SPB78]|nr:conserved hypothetical protein [Streptomyces sp. SPB78]
MTRPSSTRSTVPVSSPTSGRARAPGTSPPGGARSRRETVAPAHTISQEETFYVLSGLLRLTIGGESAELGVGDAAVAPAGSELAVANPADRPAHMWVTTRAGLSAELADGSTINPPWSN